MDPSYTQDLRNRPEKHPETPTDAILIIVSMIRELCSIYLSVLSRTYMISFPL